MSQAVLEISAFEMINIIMIMLSTEDAKKGIMLLLFFLLNFPILF